MRSLKPGAALLVAVIALPAGLAELGDQEFSTGAWRDGLEPQWHDAQERGWYRTLDILDAGFTNENETHLEAFLVTQAPVEMPPDQPEVNARMAVQFMYGGHRYEALVREVYGNLSGELRVLPEGGFPQRLQEIDVLIEGASWRIPLDKQWVRTTLDEPILPGLAITEIYAFADGRMGRVGPSVGGYGTSVPGCAEQGVFTAVANVCVMRVRDRFPDESFLAPFIPSVHREGHEAYEAWTTRPLIPSNGEATTHIFPMHVRSTSEDAIDMAVSWTAPEEWTIAAPKSFMLQPGESTRFAVLATVPFQHQHGHEKTMDVVFNGSGEETRIGLTVRWLEVPQPGGHHPTLYFHTAEPESRVVWMNTLAEDPVGTRGVIEAFESVSPFADPPTYRAVFDIPLQPALAMGINADMDSIGTLRLPLLSSSSGSLQIIGGIDATVRDASGSANVTRLFDLEPWQDAIVAGDAMHVELVVKATDAADHFPLNGEGRLALNIVATGEMDALATASWQMGDAILTIDASESSMRLPLHEFHDVAAGSAEAFRFTPTGELPVRLPPGGTALVQFDLEAGDVSAVTLSAVGTAADWITFHQDRLSQPWPRPVLIRIDAPPDVEPGTEHTAVLHAVATGTVADTTYSFSIIVDDTAPDQAEEAEVAFKKDVKSPAGALLGLVALALVLGRKARD